MDSREMMILEMITMGSVAFLLLLTLAAHYYSQWKGITKKAIDEVPTERLVQHG